MKSKQFVEKVTEATAIADKKARRAKLDAILAEVEHDAGAKAVAADRKHVAKVLKDSDHKKAASIIKGL